MTDLPASQRMSDREIAAQVTTFLLAGFETSSTSLTWILHALADYPEVQTKLREEILAVTDATPDASVPSFPLYLSHHLYHSILTNSL